MSILIIVVIVALIVGFLIFSQKQGDQPTRSNKQPLAEIISGQIKKNRILTNNEQPMFYLLKEVLEPRYVVLAQVSFNALIWSKNRAIRNRFNRKMADFVVCDANMNIIAVVELDDASHQGQEQRDADRDCLLHEAGIKVIRYPRRPDFQQVQRDFNL